MYETRRDRCGDLHQVIWYFNCSVVSQRAYHLMEIESGFKYLD
jgi:hypothetical protein